MATSLDMVRGWSICDITGISMLDHQLNHIKPDCPCTPCVRRFRNFRTMQYNHIVTTLIHDLLDSGAFRQDVIDEYYRRYGDTP